MTAAKDLPPATLEQVARALSFISCSDRDMWVRMGMAIKVEFGDEGYLTWLNWSEGDSSFKESDAKAVWKSFKLGGRVTIGSLFSEAKKHGYKFDKSEVPMRTQAEIEAQRVARAEREAKAEVERVKRAEAAAARAQSQWRMAAREGHSPYLERKQVEAVGCRYLKDGSIIIPLKRYDTQPPTIVGKQEIDAHGAKKYSNGMDRTGSMLQIGEPVDGDVILAGEGYATMLTVRQETGYQYPVAVGFDTTGLMWMALSLRARYPSSPILFCGDDDYLTGDAGRIKAQAAADAVGNAAVVLPVFSVERPTAKDAPQAMNDFNDLRVVEGRQVVSDQLKAAIFALVNAPPAADTSPPWSENEPAFPDDSVPRTPLIDDANSEVVAGTVESMLKHFALVYGKTDVWDSLNRQILKKSAFVACFGTDKFKEWMAHPERKVIDQRDLPALKGGRALESSGAGGGSLGDMCQRFVLLFGTETVWDRQLSDVIGLSAMRAAYPIMTPVWQDNPNREMVDAKNLVFDPTQQASPDTHINMFTGFPLTPVENEPLVVEALALLESLCSSESNAPEVFDWLLRWLAFPLQNPGAKMQTAVLMFGEKQGTGKSLFFEGIMRPIYGDYGATAGQHQLESTFTDWKSRKLFVLFEEVLSRSDRYNHLGTLKHMITGRDQRINPKNLPERVEANHLNGVFLSNEPQPIPIDMEDRRFLVVGAKAKLEKSFYDKFKVLLKQGMPSAFYEFLLRYPVGDFNEHTLPPRTDSKDGIIRFGLPGWHVFHERWKGDELSIPYCSCLSEDLHAYFLRWCERTRENKLSLTKFSELMGGREAKVRKHLKLGAAGVKVMRTVFVIEDKDGRTLEKQIESFKALMDMDGRDPD